MRTLGAPARYSMHGEEARSGTGRPFADIVVNEHLTGFPCRAPTCRTNFGAVGGTLEALQRAASRRCDHERAEHGLALP